ncbi:FAD-dependent monooxygenase [Streptomyces sp. NBC_00083]|uniref:FAD-dependent monooxygenase n=1 Tax=Streptomyces sp. NBC_00083 TaxID=2975647 RepID=UPI00225574A7|nr:FAD-dependent monooxygenase [Streptomyces sp. NBC_00083]MCX5385203.1 FAD-dependent monooxygenase [Streptomyces sp. NBC_00083]
MELNVVKEPGPDATTDVLVVGAGPTGLVLAIDLARRGIPALLVEKSDRLFPGSRGKGVQPRTLELLDDLGLVEAVLRAGRAYPRMLSWEGPDGAVRGREWDMIERATPTEQEPYANALLIGQSRLQDVLHAHLRALGGEVLFGAEVTGLVQDADGVTAAFADGRTVRARHLVAADGGRSAVRRAVGIAMEGESIDPRPMLVADVLLTPDVLVDDLNWHVWRTPTDSGAVLCPLPGEPGLYQLIVRFDDEHAAPDTSDAGVVGHLTAHTPITAGQVTEVVWASDFRPRAALATRYRAGRVLLAGDAAHIHSPAGGQGLNTSVQDAYNLGWKLAQVLRHGAPDELLDTYEDERRPIAAGVLGMSTRLHRYRMLAENNQARGETRQLGLGYRGGPLATGCAGALEAGDRAPDGPLPDGRIFDLLRGPHFTLLAFGTPAPALASAQVHVHELGAYKAYGRGLFLVRPDGYIGWAGEDATGLDGYLAALGVTDHL